MTTEKSSLNCIAGWAGWTAAVTGVYAKVWLHGAGPDVDNAWMSHAKKRVPAWGQKLELYSNSDWWAVVALPPLIQRLTTTDRASVLQGGNACGEMAGIF